MEPEQVAQNLRFIASRLASRPTTKAAVAKELWAILAAVKGADQKALEQALYGRTTPFSSEEEGVDDPEAAGSSFWWVAFDDMNMVDWTPLTDPEPVFARARELAEQYKVDPDRAEKDVRKNWDDYQKNYMAEHQEKLKKLGLM